MQFGISRDEEIIFREIVALAGDLDQLARNLIRHREERVKTAEENQAKREERKERIARGDDVTITGAAPPYMASLCINKLALLEDLVFIQVRLEALMDYIRPSSPRSSS